jgi:hypothetical protein
VLALGFVTSLAAFGVALYTSEFGFELLSLNGIEFSVSGGSHIVDAVKREDGGQHGMHNEDGEN